MATLAYFPDQFPKMLDKINVTKEFISTDSKEAFDENYDKLHSYYKNADISYVNNSHGFRSKEFDTYTKNFGLAIGCSHTYGVGVKADDTWHAELGRLVNKQFVNLGCESHGILAVSLVAKEWCKYFAKPDIVVVQIPDICRKTTATLQQGYTDIVGVSHDEWITTLTTEEQMISEHDTTQELHLADTINSLVDHFNAWGIPVRLWSYFDDHSINRYVKYNIQTVSLDEIDISNFLARDLSHQGHITQFRAAGELAEHCFETTQLYQLPEANAGTLTEENQKEYTRMLRSGNRIIYN